MAGRVFSKWFTEMRPYLWAYREVWVGVGIMEYLYFKLSYGGKKAVKDKPAH